MRVPLVLQSHRTECGLAALLMIANCHGHDLDLAAMRERCGPIRPDLRAILGAAERLGLIARPLRISLRELPQLTVPAILHWEFGHFVVVARVRRKHVIIHDPASGRRVLNREEFGRSFTGIAVEFTRAPELPLIASRRLATLPGLVASFPGLGRYLAIMLSLLILAQLLALVPAVATQLLIDEVVLGQDRRWLIRVVAGLALVMLATVAIDAMRRRAGLFVGVRLATESTTLVIRHLLRLPAATVASRAVGDLMSRLDSLRPLRTVLIETTLQAATQCTIALTTLLLMFAYSGTLAGVTMGALLTVALLHGMLLPRARSLTTEALLSSARASNSLIETLRAYVTVHALGLGPQRLGHWQYGFIAAANAHSRRQRLVILAGAGQGSILVLEQAAFLVLGIGGVIDGQLTLGALFAFMSLRGRLISAALELVVAARELYLARSHSDRVADIITERTEAPPAPGALHRRMQGAVAAAAIGFAYPGAAAILHRFDISIAAGESVVFRGPSGCGKSTLLRLLAGSLTPQRGRLYYDEMPASVWDLDALRRQFGIVLQSDRLFEGSVLDNITCFAVNPDFGRVREAAELAAIWGEVQDLPMALHTPVGGASGGFSGGQVQRLLLARAMYRRPRILFLDEATSHLDQETERRVIDNLQSLRVTIVSVAHRRNAVSAASRIIEFDKPANVTFRD